MPTDETRDALTPSPRATLRRKRERGTYERDLINAVLDPAAGSESGRIGNLNPQSALKKK